MTKRVLSAEFGHETNTFCKISTTIENFRRQCYLDNRQEIEASRQGTRTAIGATYEASERYQWNLIIPVVAGANPSGRITDETFETITSLILLPLQQDSEIIDGILLHLHGAIW